MDDSFTIGLLITGASIEELRDVAPDGHAGMYHRWLGGRDLAFREWDVFDGAFPDAASDADAYIVTGSPAGVYEDWAWIPPLEDFVRAAAETRPVLGICFGHQLLAQAFGGTVVRAEQGWGLGLQRYAIHAPQNWLSETDELRLLAMHQDQVVVPPPGARVFAGNDFCAIAGYTIGERVIGIQGHPEFTPAFARGLYDMREHKLSGEAVIRAKASIDEGPEAHSMADDLTAWMRKGSR